MTSFAAAITWARGGELGWTTCATVAVGSTTATNKTAAVVGLMAVPPDFIGVA
jgi:hypothetical protein